MASLYGRNSLLDIVERTAREIFVPLTVGGGLRSVEDIRAVLRAGADKVSLNTGAIARPELITEASRMFGSSTVVVSVEAIRMPNGGYEAHTDNGREGTGLDAIDWAVHAAELGAGELLVTSIDQEGTGKGYDLELTRAISEKVSIPVIASGGAGKPGDISLAVESGKADAVSVASVLHYNAVQEIELGADAFEGEGNTRFLENRTPPSWIEAATIEQLKGNLVGAGLQTRQEGQ